MIRQADQKDKEKLERIWEEVLDRDDLFLDPRVLEALDAGHIWIDEEEGDMVATLTMSPYDAVISGKEVRGCYLSCLATMEDYRCRGIMGRLLKTAEDYARASGLEALFLIPAEDSLIPYYEKKGFDRKYYYDSVMVEKRALEKYVAGSEQVSGKEKRSGAEKKRLPEVTCSLEELSMDEIWEFYYVGSRQAKEDHLMYTRAQLEREIQGFLEEDFHIYALKRDDLNVGYMLCGTVYAQNRPSSLLVVPQALIHPDYLDDWYRCLTTFQFDQLLLQNPMGDLPGEYTRELLALGKIL
ncbi:MAG: GNAT family N-acetyltransferase [Lachnospiraceae bacterium]|nr:GNAT family N-acetyltransferase [Lachnospiraceae bacterium]